MRKRKRTDIAWQYCTIVDNNVGRLRCNFCGHVMWGGVTRLKHHLACIKGNVIPCRSCPPEVLAQIQEYLGHDSQNNEVNIDRAIEQVNVMSIENEEPPQQQPEYWQGFMVMAANVLGNGSQENEGNTDGGYMQVNEMRSGRNQEQLSPEQEYWPVLFGENVENTTHYSQENIENADGVDEQVNDMSSGGNEPDQEYWPIFDIENEENFTPYWQKDKENMDGGSEGVNDIRSGGTEVQLQPDQEYWPMFFIENAENLTHCSQKKIANIDAVNELVNDLRIINKEHLRPNQAYRPLFVSEIKEYLARYSQKNEVNIDSFGELVKDMRAKATEDQSQPKQERWQKGVSDDMFEYLCKDTFGHGWEDRILGLTTQPQQNNLEDAGTVGDGQHDSEIAFWYNRIPRGEGSNGTKPVLSYREFGMSSDEDDSDSDSELGF